LGLKIERKLFWKNFRSQVRQTPSQGVMSEILNGKRNLNLRQIKLLAALYLII